MIRKIQPKDTRAPAQRWLARLVGALGCAALPWIAVGCSAPQTGPEAPKARYTPEAATLFDDILRPELFGIEQPRDLPENDRLLAARLQQADAVFVGKVVTVTRERGGGVRTDGYSVNVRPVGPALSGVLPAGVVTLRVGELNPVYRWLDELAATFVAKPLIVFTRSYPGELHFHATVDTPSVRALLNRAKLRQAPAK
jgi:hypothetical protein